MPVTFESSHQRCSTKESVLKIFAKFTGKHLCQSLFFNKVEGLRTARFFPLNFVKFLRTDFLQNTFERLLLDLLIRSTDKVRNLKAKHLATLKCLTKLEL